MSVIKVDTRQITDWNSFHEVFRALMGFPITYGHNMNAWIDCMSSLDNPEAGMSTIHVLRGHVVTLLLEHVEDFEKRCPEMLLAICDGSAFVNWRRVEVGDPAVLAIAYFRGA
jgi:hypothetical protein